MTDFEIIQGCIKNESKACSELYKKYYNTLLLTGLKYSKNRQDAEDVVQDGLIKIFKNIDKYSGSGSFEGWMKVVVKNVALKKYTTLRSKNEIYEDISMLTDLRKTDESPYSNVCYKEIRKKIEKLPEGYKKVFKLYAIDGFSHDEIGEILEIKAGTSRSQFIKARRYLKKMMDEKS
jgi:RNA polymerase sigma-70 factor (ECF subfamily)